MSCSLLELSLAAGLALAAAFFPADFVAAPSWWDVPSLLPIVWSLSPPPSSSLPSKNRERAAPRELSSWTPAFLGMGGGKVGDVATLLSALESKAAAVPGHFHPLHSLKQRQGRQAAIASGLDMAAVCLLEGSTED